MGVGAAARAYFGKDPLSICRWSEAATLAGMIKAPNNYSPVRQAGSAPAAAPRLGARADVGVGLDRRRASRGGDRRAPLEAAPQDVVVRRGAVLHRPGT